MLVFHWALYDLHYGLCGVIDIYQHDLQRITVKIGFGRPYCVIPQLRHDSDNDIRSCIKCVNI